MHMAICIIFVEMAARIILQLLHGRIITAGIYVVQVVLFMPGPMVIIDIIAIEDALTLD